MKKATAILTLMTSICLLFVGCQPADNTSVTTTTTDDVAATTITTTVATAGSDTTDSSTTTVARDDDPTTATVTTTIGQGGQQTTTTTKLVVPGTVVTGTTTGTTAAPVDDNRYGKRDGFGAWGIEVLIPSGFSQQEGLRLGDEFEKLYKRSVTLVFSSQDTLFYKLRNLAVINNSPELAFVHYEDFPVFASNNLLQPLDEYLVEKDILNLTAMESFASYDGKHYALMPKQYPYAIYYNADMFDEAKVKTPLEYYNEGTWNWENFRKTAAAMTGLKNGEVSTFGFGIDDETAFLLSAQTDAIKIENGIPKLNIDNSPFTSAMEFFYTMVNTDKSVATQRRNNFEAFLEGNTAMVYRCSDQETIDSLTAAGFKWDVVPFPKAPGVNDYYGTDSGYGWALGYNCKNPVGGMAFAEFHMNQVADSQDRIGFSAEQKERLSSIITTYSRINCYGMKHSFHNGFCETMRGNASLSATLEEYAPEWARLIERTRQGEYVLP